MLSYHYQDTGFQDEQSFVPRNFQEHAIAMPDETTTHPWMNPDCSTLSYDLGNDQAEMFQPLLAHTSHCVSDPWSAAIVENFDNNSVQYAETLKIPFVKEYRMSNTGTADYDHGGIPVDYAGVAQQMQTYSGGTFSSAPVEQQVNAQAINNLVDVMHNCLRIDERMRHSFPPPTWNPAVGIYNMHQEFSPLMSVGTPEQQINIAATYQDFGPSASTFRTYDQAAQRSGPSHHISPINHRGMVAPSPSTSAHFTRVDGQRDAMNIRRTEPRPSYPTDLLREQRIQTQNFRFHPPAVAPYMGTQQQPGPMGQVKRKNAAASSSVLTKKAARTSARRAVEERRTEEAAQCKEKKVEAAKKKRGPRKPSIIPPIMHATHRLNPATQQINSIPCFLPPSESEFLIPLLNGALSGGPTEAADGYPARNRGSASSSSSSSSVGRV